jgi:hypothetical protein
LHGWGRKRLQEGSTFAHRQPCERERGDKVIKNEEQENSCNARGTARSYFTGKNRKQAKLLDFELL